MGFDWKQWIRSDIIYGVVAPVLVVLLIVAISQLGSLYSAFSNCVRSDYAHHS